MLSSIRLQFLVCLHASRQNTQCYIHVFNAIRNMLENWTPTSVMTDFEAAEISAVREVFPQAIITGSFEII